MKCPRPHCNGDIVRKQEMGYQPWVLACILCSRELNQPEPIDIPKNRLARSRRYRYGASQGIPL